MTDSEMAMEVRNKIRNKYAEDWRQPILKGRIIIQTDDAENIPLVPNDVQKELMDLIWDKWKTNKEPIRILIPKARRYGISTFCESIGYSISGFRHNTSAFILGYDADNAKTIFEMTRRMHENMEIFLRTQTKASNAQEIVFKENDSKIVIGSAQNKEIRGKGIHFFHGSEVAFYPNAKETLGGLLQSIPEKPRTIILLESTGNGIGNWFEKTCHAAERGENNWTLFFIPWWKGEKYQLEIPDNYKLTPQTSGRWGNEVELMEKYPAITPEKLYWRRRIIDDKFEGDLQFFMQEFPSDLDECFQGSGYPVFDQDKLKKLQAHVRIPQWTGMIDGKNIILNKDKYDGWLKVFTKPETAKWRNRYVVGADTGGVSDNADYSVAYVYDRWKREICATAHGHFDAYEFAQTLVVLATWYQNATLTPETNQWDSQTDDMGVAVIDNIKKRFNYSNFYTRKVRNDQGRTDTSRIGWHTNRETKQLIVDRLRRFVNKWEEEPIQYADKELIYEMQTYIVARTKTGVTTWEAAEEHHDDRVMAFGITLCVADELPSPKPAIPIQTKSTTDPMEALGDQ